MNEPDSAPRVESRTPASGEDSPAAAASKPRSRTYRWVIEVVVIVAAAFVLALLVQQFLVKPF
ncbi:MAG TPA: hypothetical protein VJP78_07820, partial [Thermoleophilia bacterium]|nr:hypothetical protein [Thermoleophilia bacterium]